MTRTKHLLATLAIAGLIGVAAPLLGVHDAALAAGGGGGSNAGGGNSNDDDDSSASSSDRYVEAQRLVQAGEYEDAIDVLEEIDDDEPGNADVLNYLGYSHRKLGDTSKALAYYLRALANEPEHVGANEYLGELYLEMGNLPKAEERLAVLQSVCSGCMEEAELAEKIAAFKASQG
jgi:tetratricopeptide (TPR) repeat protein